MSTTKTDGAVTGAGCSPGSATHYRDAWLSVVYDATGDYVKSKRAMELAEINGLFDPIEAMAQSSAGSADAPPTLWKMLRRHGVGLYTAQMICNDVMLNGVTVPSGAPAQAAPMGEQEETFDEGVTHAVEVLARWLDVTDYVGEDGSEDYDTDLANTMLNILQAKGLYDRDENVFAALRSPDVAAEAWRPIETAPITTWGKTNRLLVWSKQLGGVCVGEVGNMNGYVWANVGSYHGNAIEHWGVTHWQPALDGPAVSSTEGKTP